MNALNKEIRAVIPKKVMVFYTDQSHYQGETKYIEWAEIINDRVGPYQPLSLEALKDMIGFADYHSLNKYQFKGMIPKNVVYLNNSSQNLILAWYVPGSIRNFKFHQKMYKIGYPNLVFIYRHKKLFIYAYKDAVLESDTVLYKCPFPNMYKKENMCFGNMQIQNFLDQDLDRMILKMNDAFYSSSFNDHLTESVTVTNTANLFNRLIKKPVPFPEKELVRNGQNFSNVLKKIIR